MVDFPGRLAAVFFVAGCNFNCGFCHNAALMGTPRKTLPWKRLDKACAAFATDWVDGAVITGGEPTLSDELPELLEFFARRGWKTKLDTNGSHPDILQKCIAVVDYVAMDIKTGRDGYAELTGFDDISAIERSIAIVKEQARDYEFRTTVIEHIHTDEQMLDIAEMISDARRYAIQPFVPRDDMPDERLRTKPRTSSDQLAAIAELVGGCADEVIVRGT